MPGVDADVSCFLFSALRTAGETVRPPACLPPATLASGYSSGYGLLGSPMLMGVGLDLEPFEWICSRVSLCAVSFALLRLVGLSMTRTVEFLQAPNPSFRALGLDNEGTPDMFDVDSPACDVLPDAVMSTLDSARPSMPLETAPLAVIKLLTAQPTPTVVAPRLVNGSIASLTTVGDAAAVRSFVVYGDR